MDRRESMPASSGIKRNKKACTECRQQKVRCDALEDCEDPCTRCRKMKLNCVISDPFKREHKRQRLSELEHEAYELRRRLDTQPPVNPWGTPSITPSINAEPNNILLTPVHNGPTASPNHRAPVISPKVEENGSEEPRSDPREPTIPQTIEGSTLSAPVIDELFQRYFQEFHKFLPILDADIRPNDYYLRSKFLFWAIVAVASRNFPKDPTLLDQLGDKVLTLALMSLKNTTIPIIKGCLMLLTWPIPRSAAAGADITFAISGSLIHMAMQIGLHIPTSSQDFSRVKVRLTEAEISKRAELWGYCILVYQRSCSFKGHAPLSMLELYQDADQRHALFSRISPSLKFQLKLNSLLTRCCSAMLQHGLRIMNTREHESGLDLLIRVFEATVRDVEPEAVTELDKFYFYLSKLTVQVFYFYKMTPNVSPNYLLTRLYSGACQVIHYVDRLNQDGYRLAAAPFHFVSATNVASIALLRLLKASSAQYLDYESAKETLFLGVNILKRLSLETNDIPARVVVIITQLWNSEKAFRRPDGSEHTALRIRTRLAMSHVFDTIWWWREEFGGQSGAYPLQSQQPQTSPNSAILADTPSVVNLQAYNNTTPNGGIFPEMNFVDDQLLAELGWTNNQNYLYSAMPGPMATDWYSPTNVAGFAL